MELRCIKGFTLPSPYKVYDDGKVYQVPVDKYDLKKTPWLKYFDAPAAKEDPPAPSKKREPHPLDGIDDLK